MTAPATVAAADAAAPRSKRPTYVLFVPWPIRDGSGVNHVVLGLSRAMQERYRPEIVVTGWQKPEDGQIWLKMAAPGLGPRQLVGFVFYMLRNLPAWLRLAQGSAALNPHYPGPEVLPLVILRRLGLIRKLILSVHGADVPKKAKVSALRAKLYAWIYGSADLVVACSGALARQVKELSPQARVTPIWNGIAAPPAQIPAERPLAERYLVSVAAFVQKKGHDTLLEAYVRIRRRDPELQLVLIGGRGPELEDVQRRVAELGLTESVHLHVNVPHEQVWSWVHHAECFVLASREEPFGISILESALVKTPVVATSVGGVPEFLINDVHGLLVAPDAPDELARAVIRTLDEREATLRRVECFYNKAREFTWDAAFERYREAAQLP